MELVGGFQISVCFLQDRLHLVNCNDGGIIINRVDFLKTVKAFLNRSNSIQPLQGCLADIISCHKENRRGQVVPVGIDYAVSSEYNETQHCGG